MPKRFAPPPMDSRTKLPTQKRGPKRYENDILSLIKSKINNQSFHKKFGFYFEYNPELKSIFVDNNTEYDLIISGEKRSLLGQYTSMDLNVEIERTRLSNSTLNTKSEDDKLLIFILVNGASKAAIESNKYYSLLNYNIKNNNLSYIPYNFSYLEKLLPGNNAKRNNFELEKMYNLYKGNPKIMRRSFLYFISDLLMKEKNPAKLVFFEPFIDMVTIVYENHSENCFLHTNKTENSELKLNIILSRHLKKHKSKEMQKKILSNKTCLISPYNENRVLKTFENNRIKKYYFVTDGIPLNTSLVKTINI